jgi:hypothetical protein
MALVLGPELDVFLRGIGEDLKGKTILEEPYVEKKTIVRAVSEQNKVILALQAQFLQMQEIERVMQRKLEMMQEKVTYLEKYTEKVDDIEGILREKIPLVDKIDEVVKEHDAALDQVSIKLNESTQAFSAFKIEARGGISKNRDDLRVLRTEVDSMPENIIISSRQVTHSVNDEKPVVNTTLVDDGKELLVDIIAQQEQHAYVQDETIQNIEKKVDDNEIKQGERNGIMKSSIADLMEWKRAQSAVDLEKMKENQDDMQLRINEHVEILSQKMSKEDVNYKLQQQFNEIVDHLQSALSSIESEEADFKRITDSLSEMCEKLREKKADKAEMLALRKQFIENQVEGGGSRAGSTLDNEGIRRILLNYPTKETVQKMLQGNTRPETIPEIVRIDSKILQLQSIIKQMAASLSDNSLSKNRNSSGELPHFEDVQTSEYEENSCPENSHPVQKNRNESLISLEDRQSIGSKEQIPNLNNPKRYDYDYSNFIEKDPTAMLTEDIIEQKFPPSNVLKGVLGKVPHDKQVNHGISRGSIHGRPHSQSRQSRPSSAPHKQSSTEQQNVVKKHSLPAILTSITKTMRPRSKMKSKLKHQGNIIHKGSYHVMNPSMDLGKSSDHFDEISRPTSSECHSRKKAYMIRTSIE